MSFESSPGLRLEASTSRRSWTYRFKSPVDGRMRQQKLGEWPVMSYAAAIAEWQQIRARHDAGEDPVLTRKAANEPVMVSTPESYTVRKPCEDSARATLTGTAIRSAPGNAAILRSEPGAAWDYALDAGRVPEDTRNWWRNWWREIMRGKLRTVGRKRGGKVENVKRVLNEDELCAGESVANLPLMGSHTLTANQTGATRSRPSRALPGRSV